MSYPIFCGWAPFQERHTLKWSRELFAGASSTGARPNGSSDATWTQCAIFLGEHKVPLNFMLLLLGKIFGNSFFFRWQNLHSTTKAKGGRSLWLLLLIHRSHDSFYRAYFNFFHHPAQPICWQTSTWIWMTWNRTWKFLNPYKTPCSSPDWMKIFIRRSLYILTAKAKCICRTGRATRHFRTGRGGLRGMGGWNPWKHINILNHDGIFVAFRILRSLWFMVNGLVNPPWIIIMVNIQIYMLEKSRAVYFRGFRFSFVYQQSRSSFLYCQNHWM